MADGYMDILKVIVPALAGIAGGYWIKRWELGYQSRKSENDLWTKQRQSHWLPLLRATGEFKARLEQLRDIYKNKPGTGFDRGSVSGDFRELYALDRGEIDNPWTHDANAPRENGRTVQYVRARMCQELTLAQSSLYISVKYLGYAQLVWRDLTESVLILPDSAQRKMMDLIAGVRASLQGPSGAGIFAEQQEYMGETVLTASETVVSNLEFRRRLLELPGWEQYKNLLLFFVMFAPKVEKEEYEVGATIRALQQLETKLIELRDCSSRERYEGLWVALSEPGAIAAAARKTAVAAEPGA